jgi:hypothetical protein
MANNTTIFNQILSLIPRYDFDKIIDKYASDKGVRKFSTFNHLVLLIYTQLTLKDSLRDVNTSLQQHTNNHYHLSIHSTSRSTFSDANKKRDYHIFKDLFQVLLQKIKRLTPKHKFDFDNSLYLLDSSIILLCLSLVPWAKYKTKKGAVKIHTVLNMEGCIPEFLTITDGKTSDITEAKQAFNFPPDSIIVMDRGYIDFKWLYSLHKKDSFFVTRAKRNLNYFVIGQQEVEPGTGVVEDLTIELTGKDAVSDYPELVRMIKYYDEKTKKYYTFLTNNFQLAAETIAEIYKSRWGIELFFKWIKQNLKIKAFLGTSVNAIMSQIWTAMITYLLLAFIEFQTKYSGSRLDLIRIIRETLFKKVAFIEILSLDRFSVNKIYRENPYCQQLTFL